MASAPGNVIYNDARGRPSRNQARVCLTRCHFLVTSAPSLPLPVETPVRRYAGRSVFLREAVQRPALRSAKLGPRLDQANPRRYQPTAAHITRLRPLPASCSHRSPSHRHLRGTQPAPAATELRPNCLRARISESNPSAARVLRHACCLMASAGEAHGLAHGITHRVAHCSLLTAWLPELKHSSLHRGKR